MIAEIGHFALIIALAGKCAAYRNLSCWLE